ncbi:MAG: HAD family hydrolase [Thermoleophilia bacterium]|nr:HAD family hydrolase [Thermoleophilia bacterium]
MPADRSDHSLPAAIVDIDGTLVDSNYQHALAWFRALRRHGVTHEVWRLHRLIGMGGDHVVEEVAGAEIEERLGDEIRAAEQEAFGEMIEEVTALPRATELLRALAAGGRRVVLATSAQQWQVDHYLELLDARDIVHGWTTADDVEASKPEPDLVRAAIAEAGGGPAVMVGDSTWDCISAARAGIPTVSVLTGGFSREELVEAGAIAVYDSLDALIDGLAETPLGAPANGQGAQARTIRRPAS